MIKIIQRERDARIFWVTIKICGITSFSIFMQFERLKSHLALPVTSSKGLLRKYLCKEEQSTIKVF